MADGAELKTLGQFSNRRIAIAQSILRDLAAGKITAQPPPPFRDARYAGQRILSSEDEANAWIRFGMPPVIVHSAYFANSRISSEATAASLEMAYKILQASQSSEKECSGWEFIAKGARYVKVFTSRCSFENDHVTQLMDNEIFSRLDELWLVLTKGHFPEPFDDRRTAAATEAKIAAMKQRWRGTPSFGTEPSPTSWLAVTRTAEYFEVMDELTKVNPRSPSDNANYFAKMKQMVETQMRHLGFSLRYHNKHHPGDQIILQDVMKDVINFETEQPKGRSAAQNYFLCLLALGTTIERHKTGARGGGNLAKVSAWTDIQNTVVQTFDVPLGILMSLGYNVTIADGGTRYSEKERRHACHSQIRDFVTTLTATQGGTGGTLHNFDHWDLPLKFNDMRMPLELDAWNNEEPPWSQDDPAGGQGTSSTTFSQSGPQPQSSATPGETVQPKKMPRPTPGSGATSSSQSAFRTGPGPEPGTSNRTAESERDPDQPPNEDWIKRKRPPGIEKSIHSGMGYDNQEQRISFFKSSRNHTISSVEGPHSTNTYGTNLGWRQYLRRLTFHAALTYNILTEGQLDSQMVNESDYEWLKLYHHIITTTELVRCKGYPITEVLAMLALGVHETVDGQLREKVKKLGSQVGQFIVKKPWIGDWDELGGQVRNNRCLILTDLTYQTRSNSRTSHDIAVPL